MLTDQEPSRPRILPELWPHIIDCLSEPSSSTTLRAYIPDEHESRRICALKACSLVCREWRIHAQLHLYSIIWVPTGTALWKLIHTLSSRPDLVRHVVHLVATPSTWVSIDAPISDYLPIIPLLAIHPSSISHIQLANFIWDPQSYGWQYSQGFRNRSVTRIELIGAIVSSLVDILPFIASFRSLVNLTMVGIYLERQATEEELLRLQAQPSNHVAESLRCLEIGGGGPGIKGVHLFGNKIEHFRLDLQVGETLFPFVQHYCSSLSNYDDLKSLHVTFEPWMTMKPPLAGSIDEGERIWTPIHDALLAILHAIQSPSVHRLEIGLLPQQQEPPNGEMLDGSDDGTGIAAPWNQPCSYRHTRTGMMDVLFANDIRDALLGPIYATLAVVKLVVHETPELAMNEVWWRNNFIARLGLNPAVVQIEFSPSDDAVYNGVWKSG